MICDRKDGKFASQSQYKIRTTRPKKYLTEEKPTQQPSKHDLPVARDEKQKVKGKQCKETLLASAGKSKAISSFRRVARIAAKGIVRSAGHRTDSLINPPQKILMLNLSDPSDRASSLSPCRTTIQPRFH